MATMLQTEVEYQTPVMMATAVSTPRKLWEHPDPKSTAMWKFMQDANARRGLHMQVRVTIWNRRNEEQELDEASRWLIEIFNMDKKPTSLGEREGHKTIARSSQIQ
jgi:hypothetical protein